MIIDHHDDLGTYLRQVAPSIANSTFVKEAAWEERSEMLDRNFAVILVEPSGKEHRKLAMQDAGNTLSSIVYFLTREHDLPESAVKVAATNLLNSAIYSGLYDQLGDEFLYTEKHGSAFDMLAALADLRVNDNEVIDSHRVHVKTAEAYVPHPMMVFNSQEMPKMKLLALTPSQILQSPFGIVKQASAIWEEFSPVEKRKVALIIKTATADAAVALPSHMEQYTGNALNPLFESLMKARQHYTSDVELQNDYERLSKVAFAIPLEDTTEALFLLDEQAGLSHRYGTKLPDPVLAVYGTPTKVASWSWNYGGDYCSEQDLEALVKDPFKKYMLEDMFDADMVREMLKDPVAEFKKRPVEQQIIIARMANTTRL